MTKKKLETREEAEERRRKHRERVKARRAAKYDSIPDGGVSVSPLGLNKGGPHNVRHGLYRNMLDDEERRIHADLLAEYRRAYSVDTVADEDMLHLALAFLVKACRKEPEMKESDKNVRSYQAFYARQYAEFMDKLGLTRKQRQDESAKSDMLAAMSRLFGLGERDIIHATPKRPALTEGDEA